MQRLILFRHAKAEAKASSGEDYDRGLTERGRSDARLMGRVLAEAGLTPDLALVSSAKRTRQTWTEAAHAFGDAPARFEKALFHASAAGLRQAVEAAADEASTLMLVGHNPAVHQLAIELLVEGAAGHDLIERARAKFPTAAAIAFEIDAAGRPLYDGLFIPKAYGGGAEE
jgi:phosphohistidine phosphatase